MFNLVQMSVGIQLYAPAALLPLWSHCGLNLDLCQFNNRDGFVEVIVWIRNVARMVEIRNACKNLVQNLGTMDTDDVVVEDIKTDCKGMGYKSAGQDSGGSKQSSVGTL